VTATVASSPTRAVSTSRVRESIHWSVAPERYQPPITRPVSGVSDQGQCSPTSAGAMKSASPTAAEAAAKTNIAVLAQGGMGRPRKPSVAR